MVNRGHAPYVHHLITVRVWQEWLQPDLFEWRGELRHTGTGEIRHFRGVASLPSMLLTMLETKWEEPDHTPRA